MDESLTLSSFLKKLNDKKNSHYIILGTDPKSFVDIRTLALKIKSTEEKLKNLKKTLSVYDGSEKQEALQFLIESGDRVIGMGQEDLFDFVDALDIIAGIEPSFLDEKVGTVVKNEVYALNEADKISSARSLFLQKGINILPVIDGLKVIGELRPMDLLVSDLFEKPNPKGNLYDKNYDNNILNLPISSLINKRPITITKDKPLKELVQIMVKKKLPSLIVVDENDNLFSIVSYKDIFRMYKDGMIQSSYNIEFSGGKDLYEDEFAMIRGFADKFMKKITTISDYNNLRVTFKIIGEKDLSHKKKILIRGLLSRGNKVLQVEKEIGQGTSDEISNDKVRGKWNIPLIFQDVLSVLERQVVEEKKKNK